MAGGALLQIISCYSDIDLFLVDNPEITYFESVYKRHTPFAIHTVKDAFYTGFHFNKQCKCLLTRENGDLISNITINVKIDPLGQNLSWVNSFGHALIRSTWIEINGKKIGTLSGKYMEIYSELSIEKKRAYNQMIAKVSPTSFSVSTFKGFIEVLIPIKYWFTTMGNYLPILCLKNQLVELVIDFNSFENICIHDDKQNLIKPKTFAQLYIDYIYLDFSEREKFLKSSHTYLLEEIQYIEAMSKNTNEVQINLTLNNPVKELIWVNQRSDVVEDIFNFSIFYNRKTSRIIDTFKSAILKVNDTELFNLDASYLRLVETYYHHVGTPSRYIYTYSFSLSPDKFQPSGHFNFSNVENAKLILYFDENIIKTIDCDIHTYVYAKSYSILLISEGMAYVIQ